MASTDLRECKNCGALKPIDVFEKTTKDGKSRRAVCKPCYAQQKKERAKAGAATHKPDTVPKPTACANCGRGFPEVDFKWRSDVKVGGWRNTCNTCYNNQGYSDAYRKREREKDETAYLARNAATHLAWAHRNRDKVREQQMKTATEPDRKLKAIRTSAAQRGIQFDDADCEAMRDKLMEACHYCGFVPDRNEPLNGLDRVDSQLGYSATNTVSCCATCNAMKGPVHMDEFITNVRAIVAHQAATVGAEPCASLVPTSVTRSRLTPFAGTQTRRDADDVDKTNDLPHSAKIQLWSGACYLCGRTPALGIDRVDSSVGYTDANVRPCCSVYCNYMKKDLGLEQFLQHVAYVHVHTQQWVLGDVMDMQLITFGGVMRIPVAALGAAGERLVVFPSSSTAAEILGVSNAALSKAVHQGMKLRGKSWVCVRAQDLRDQHVGQAAGVISQLCCRTCAP